jgi:hypothetical protein
MCERARPDADPADFQWMPNGAIKVALSWWTFAGEPRNTWQAPTDCFTWSDRSVTPRSSYKVCHCRSIPERPRDRWRRPYAGGFFNNHYYAAGTFFEKNGFNSNTFGAPNFFVLHDPRTFLPGMPLAGYAGVRAAF